VNKSDAVPVRTLDSINKIAATDRDAVVVAGSHGGLYSAYKAVAAGVRGVILNDAGGGHEDAGLACLAFCDGYGMAAAVVSHWSARIGDAADMRARGVIRGANAAAQALGVVPGMACAQAIARLAQAPRTVLHRPADMLETRHEEALRDGVPRVVCIDSASLIRPEDAGRVVVTGSHGGLIGGDAQKAINVPCAFAAFNDAGVGVDRAGLGRLAPLEARGVAAVTVSHARARIGDARSTLSQGIITHANARAVAMGAEPEMALRDLLTTWLATQQGKACG